MVQPDWWTKTGQPAVRGEPDQIGTTELVDGAVTTPKLGDGAVTTAKLGADAVTGPKIADAAVGLEHLAEVGYGVVRHVDVVVSSAELLALNTTPKTIVAAPGAGLAIVPASPIAAILHLDYNSAAYDGIAAGEDLSFKYTDGSGTELFTVEATGFLDETADAVRYAADPTLVTPEANKAVVLHMLTGNIATGNSPLRVRFYYRIVPTALA